jgi:hypothetical protein
MRVMTAMRALLGVAAIFAASCQTYDFEPVSPLAIAQTTQSYKVNAHQLKPDMMILLDKSGSMTAQLPGGTNCGTCVFPSCNESMCPTRMGQMRVAMGGFLTGSGRVARMGLTIFPHNDQGTVQNPTASACNAAGTSEVLQPIMVASDSDADLQAHATVVNSTLQTVTALGGTPTADSLTFVGKIPELNDPDREDFVLLLTDGLPNCNPANPKNCNVGQCTCTVTASACGVGQQYCTLGCLDEDGSVQAVKDLRMKGIKTIVVGFGSDFVGDGFRILNAMAVAGGFQRTCPNGTDAECGNGNTCDTSSKVCTKAFYSATSGSELSAALAQISDIVNANSICTYVLEATPSNQDLVSVIVDGQPIESGPDTWTLNAGKIVFSDTGMICPKLKTSTTQNPVNLEIRIVQAL